MMVKLICLVIGYCFGLFQTSYIIGRIKHTDIREHGSGNAGTTNALRTFGLKAGLLTLLGDCLKCVLASLVVRLLFREKYAEIMPLLVMITSTGCILGHNFPFYLGFRGGKGIAASLGLFLSFDWPLGLFLFGLFLVLFFITHYVSFSALTAYVVAFFAVIVFGEMGRYGMARPDRIQMYVLMGALTVLAFYQHRGNIKRLLQGTEKKTYLKKKNG